MAREGDVSEDFSKQLSNLVNALVAIAPSRNYITQFLYIVKMNGSVDYRILEEAYPDVVKDEYTREAFAKAFGVSFTDKISLDPKQYGWFLTDFIDKVFQLFEDPEFRSKVGALLKDEYPQGIPNLAEEWLDVRLKGLSSEPTYGGTAVKVLKEIVRVGRAKTDELERALGVSRGTLIECLNLLDLYKLATKDYDGSYRPVEALRKYPAVLEGM
ncbi:MAG: hypothetical protein QW328_07140 [Nitrososphaerota archaeon]